MHVRPLLDDLTRLGLAGHDFFDPPREFLERFSRELGMTKLDYWRWNRADLSIEEYRDLLDEYGIDVYCVNLDTSHGRFGRGETAAAVSDAARLALREALAFHAPYVQVYIERADGATRAERLDTIVRQLTPIANETHDQGVMLLVENNFDFRNIDPDLWDFSRSPSALGEIVDRVGHDRLGITFDPVNSLLTGDEAVDAYEDAADYVANIHLKDCVMTDVRDDAADRKMLRDGDRRFARSVAVGDGDIDWPGFAAHVGRQGFSGWWTVDPFCDPEDALGWTRRSLGFVRGEPVGVVSESEQPRKDQR